VSVVIPDFLSFTLRPPVSRSNPLFHTQTPNFKLKPPVSHSDPQFLRLEGLAPFSTLHDGKWSYGLQDEDEDEDEVKMFGTF